MGSALGKGVHGACCGPGWQPAGSALPGTLGAAAPGSQQAPTSHSEGFSGSALQKEPSTTSMGGSRACTPRAMIDLAVPRRPEMAMPPTPAAAANEGTRIAVINAGECAGRGGGQAQSGGGRAAESAGAPAPCAQVGPPLRTCVHRAQQQRLLDVVHAHHRGQRVGTLQAHRLVRHVADVLRSLHVGGGLGCRAGRKGDGQSAGVGG